MQIQMRRKNTFTDIILSKFTFTQQVLKRLKLSHIWAKITSNFVCIYLPNVKEILK